MWFSLSLRSEVQTWAFCGAQSSLCADIFFCLGLIHTYHMVHIQELFIVILKTSPIHICFFKKEKQKLLHKFQTRFLFLMKRVVFPKLSFQSWMYGYPHQSQPP